MSLAAFRDKAMNRKSQGNVIEPKVVQPEVVQHVPQYQEPVRVQPVYQEQQRPMYQEPVRVQPVYQEPQRVEPVYQGQQRPVYQEQHVYEEQRQQHVYEEQRQASNYVNHMADEVIQAPSENQMVLYGADNYVLSVFGLSSEDSIKIIGYESVPDVTPVRLNNIKDKNDKLSNKLIRIMEATKCTVLPLRECGIFAGVSELKDFDIMSYNGVEYASYKGFNYDTRYRDNLKSIILDRLGNAESFGLVDTDLGVKANPQEAMLTRDFVINGNPSIKVPGLCVSEWRYITRYFEYYHARCSVITNKFPMLTVGTEITADKVFVQSA